MMKKILSLIICVLGFVGYMNAQSIEEQVEVVKTQEIKNFKSVLVFEEGDISLNKNQEVRIEQILEKKSREIVAIRDQELSKKEVSVRLSEVKAKYNSLINMVLTTDQKAQIKKNEVLRRRGKKS